MIKISVDGQLVATHDDSVMMVHFDRVSPYLVICTGDDIIVEMRRDESFIVSDIEGECWVTEHLFDAATPLLSVSAQEVK